MPSQKLNILLVEDNEGDVELTKIAFKKGCASCDLAIVHDGEEALDYLYKRKKFTEVKRPDLILIDLNMPRMGGKEFLDVAKQDTDLKSIPVMILTSSQASAEILDCYRRHANSYILKPSSLEELIQMAKGLEDFWRKWVCLPEHL